MTQTHTKILPLEPGDHLARPEFERRYQAMPDLKKAELIEGKVYMAAALRLRSHAQPHANLLLWLGNYCVATLGLILADNPTVRLDFDNEPQPDIALFVDPDRGGQVRISPDDYIEGAPEWIAEITASSASYDLGDKKNVYRRHGVQEYLVWKVMEQALEWFILRDGDYISLEPDPDGILKSELYPGLWLDASALLRGEMLRVLEVLQAGIQTVQHQDFVNRLAECSNP